jgi:hypothetical protein
MKEIIQKITLLAAVALVAIAGTVALGHFSGNSAQVAAEPSGQ